MADQSMKIVRASIAEMVAQKIRDGIMNQTLKSGDKLREVELSRQLNVSRTPVREAFRILQSEGLVVHNPRSGVVVATIHIDDVAHLYQVRGTLEQLSAHSAAGHITPEGIAELKEINKALQNCAETNPEEAGEQDILFHITIAKFAQNSILEEQLAILHRKTRIVLNFVPMRPARIPNSCKEHDDIILALERGDAVVAQKYMDIHFCNSTRSLQEKVIAYNRAVLGEENPQM